MRCALAQGPAKTEDKHKPPATERIAQPSHAEQGVGRLPVTVPDADAEVCVASRRVAARRRSAAAERGAWSGLVAEHGGTESPLGHSLLSSRLGLDRLSPRCGSAAMRPVQSALASERASKSKSPDDAAAVQVQGRKHSRIVSQSDSQSDAFLAVSTESATCQDKLLALSLTVIILIFLRKSCRMVAISTNIK